jgi:hypothetical protein
MSIQDEFDDLMRSKTNMEKRAFDLHSVATVADLWTKTWMVQHALGQTAKHNAPGLLHAGLHNGEIGMKLGHQSDGLARTLFGRSGMHPHDQGMIIGKELRAHNLNPGGRADYLHDYIKNERHKDQLLHEQLMDEGKGKSFRPNTIPTALERSLNGEGDTKLSRFLLRHSIQEEDKKGWAHKLLHYSYASPIALAVDKRVILRPLVEDNKELKMVQGMERFMQKGKIRRGIRNYYD